MDGLLNLGKQAFQSYEESQNRQQHHEGYGGGEVGIQGSSALNSDTNGRTANVNINADHAIQHAANESGQDQSLFSNAMNHIQGMSASGNNEVDEDSVQDAHDKAYNSNSAGSASDLGASAMGSAAAMQALKMFTSGGGGGGSSSQLIGTAMSEAAKLFDQSGGGAGGSKQEAITSAGQMVMKLLLKQQVSGMFGGGSSSGGLSSLMSMASKFS